jgi:hypothetical protein
MQNHPVPGEVVEFSGTVIEFTSSIVECTGEIIPCKAKSSNSAENRQRHYSPLERSDRDGGHAPIMPGVRRTWF